MTKKVKYILVGVVLALIACAVVFLLKAGPKTTQEESAAAKPAATERAAAKPAAPSPRSTPTAAEKAPRVASAAKTADPADAADTDEPETAEDREEKLVNAFDDLTDRWQDPAPGKVTMEEINRFREQFNKVPKDRKDECIHRALNLLPDENVMLLAGILFDKTQEKDLLEAVYNDILNRDEEVKKPILKEIFKDKEHPCWADTAWILDVTNELPTTK